MQAKVIPGRSLAGTAFIAAILGLTSCSGGGIEHTGDSIFSNADGFHTPSGSSYRENMYALDGADMTGAMDDTSESGGDVPVEPDVYAIDRASSRLYAANTHRGLIAFDISDADAPAFLGNVTVQGTPKELYLTGGMVVLLLDPSYTGNTSASSVTFIDPTGFGTETVTVPTSIELGGSILDSRMVGDSLIVVTNEYASESSSIGVDMASSTTIGLASLGSWNAVVHTIDTATRSLGQRLAIEGTCSAIHVASDAVFAAVRLDDWNDPRSNIRRYDIGKDGALTDRGVVGIQGFITDRFKLDWNEGYLRVIAFDPGASWSTQVTRVFSIDWRDPEHPLSGESVHSIELGSGESLYASRFDGNIAFLVTYLTKDPLFAVSFADPDTPVQLSQLEVPGYSTHIEPVTGRGGKRVLFAVGIGDNWKTKVALYDASNPTAISQLGSDLYFGDAWSWSSANWDWKRINALPELDAFALPYYSWDESTGKGTTSVALVGYGSDVPALLCRLPDTGDVERTIPVASDRAYTYSPDRLMAWRISVAPELLSTLGIAEDVAWAGLAGSVGVKIVRDNGTLSIRTFDPVQASQTSFLSYAELAAQLDDGFWVYWDTSSPFILSTTTGTRLHLLGTTWNKADGAQQLVLASFTIAPDAIITAKTVYLDYDAAWHPFPGNGPRILGADQDRIYVFNGGLSIVDATTLTEMVGVPSRGACTAFLHDQAVDLFVAEDDPDYPDYSRIVLETWNLSDPDAPVKTAETSFPGYPLFRSPEGNYLSGYISSWKDGETRLLSVSVQGSHAEIRGESRLDGRMSATASTADGFACLTGGWWYWDYGYGLAEATGGIRDRAAKMVRGTGYATLSAILLPSEGAPVINELATLDAGPCVLVLSPADVEPVHIAAIGGSRVLVLEQSAGKLAVDGNHGLPGYSGWYAPGASISGGNLWVGLSWAGVAKVEL